MADVYRMKGKLKRKRTALCRDRIIDAATILLRREGMAGLSMRRVGQELGVAAMSLYNHVSSRDELLTAAVMKAGEGLEIPPVQPDAVEELTAIFLALYTGIRKDPWLIEYLVERRVPSVDAVLLSQRALVALEKLGYNERETWHSYHSLLHYTYGEVMVMSKLAPMLKAIPKNPNFSGHAAYPDYQRFARAAALEVYDVDPFEESLRRIVGALAIARAEKPD